MNWLVELFQLLTAWIPRMRYIQPNEAGIRLTLGSRVKEIGPGWWWYWPLIHEVIWVTVVSQVVDLLPQSLSTKDGKNLTISLTMRYSIADAKKALLNVHNYDQALQNLTRGVTAEYFSKHTLEECRDIVEMAKKAKEEVQKAARGWGVQIQTLYVDEITEALSIRLMTRGDNAKNTVDTG